MAISKLNIARSFSRAAINYDRVAHLQREVGETLLAMLPKQIFSSTSCNNVGTLVDLGCGTGYFANALKLLYPQMQYVGTDIAEGMVDYANGQFSSLSWLCGDAEQLPFDAQTIDCFFSNLTFQWCGDLGTVFTELARSLKPGGQIGFSTLGPKTLRELRSAWLQVDQFIHVNEFYPTDYWIKAIRHAGLEIDKHITELKTLQYDQVPELTQELKVLGAHNMNSGQRRAFYGRRKIQQFHEAYERFRNQQGKLPATYEVYYWLLNKPLSTIDAA